MQTHCCRYCLFALSGASGSADVGANNNKFAERQRCNNPMPPNMNLIKQNARNRRHSLLFTQVVATVRVCVYTAQLQQLLINRLIGFHRRTDKRNKLFAAFSIWLESKRVFSPRDAAAATDQSDRGICFLCSEKEFEVFLQNHLTSSKRTDG